MTRLKGSFYHIKIRLVYMATQLFFSDSVNITQSANFKLGRKFWNIILTEYRNLQDFSSSYLASDSLFCSTANFSFRTVHLTFNIFDAWADNFSSNLAWMSNSVKRSNSSDSWNNDKINKTVTTTKCKVITQYLLQD